VAHMEMVLSVYRCNLDPRYPVVCMGESSKQLLAERKVPISASPGHTARHDDEYKRCGVCNIFLACEPLAGKRMVEVSDKFEEFKSSHMVLESVRAVA